MTFTVIFLDVFEVCCLLDPGYVPVHILKPPVQARVPVAYTPEHELEMLLVYCVKSHQRRVQLDVYFCRLCCAKYKGRGGVCYHLLEPVQRFEDDSAVLLIVLLRVREAGFVDAGVEVRHHPTVHFINLSSQLGGVDVKRSFLVGFRQIVVECVVQHTHYILTLIIHNLICFLIPQYRHRVLALVFRIRLEVEVMEEFGVEKVVNSAAWVFVICRWKAPTTIVFRVWLHDAHGQKFLQAL